MTHLKDKKNHESEKILFVSLAYNTIHCLRSTNIAHRRILIGQAVAGTLSNSSAAFVTGVELQISAASFRWVRCLVLRTALFGWVRSQSSWR